MKRKNLIALIVCSLGVTLSLSSCGFLDAMKGLIDGGGNTCEHVFDEGVCTDGTATCQKKGNVVFTCTLCGYKETRKAYAQHQAANATTFQHDSTHHWQKCQWCNTVINKEEHHIHEEIVQQYDCKHEGRCIYSCEICDYEHEDVHPAEHYYPVHSHVDSTCLETGLETYDPCPGCGLTKDDYVIPKKDHHYIGEVCEWCYRDRLLDYKEKFDAGSPSSASGAILVDSEEELISLGNYVLINHTSRYLKPTYDYGSGDVGDYIRDVFTKKSTAANTIQAFGYSSYAGGKTYSIGMRAQDVDALFTQKKIYSQKSGVDYPEIVYPNTVDPIIDKINRGSKRSSTFDNFKINSHINTMTVDDSDQLYYAASHGYKPVCKTGSMSESVYNELKKILRDIVDDSMTDTEKAYQMFNWILNETQYDHGAVSYCDGDGDWTQVRAWGIEGVVFDKKAVCDAYSKTLCVMCAMEGIRCIQVSGNAHAWNRVYLDPQNDGTYEWYIMDGTWGNAKVGGGSDSIEGAIADEYLYEDTRKEEAGYKATQYAECPANSEINAFKYIHYGSGSKTTSNDLYLESSSEMSAYLDALKSTVATYRSQGKKLCVNLITAKSVNLDTLMLANKFGISASSISFVPSKDNSYYNCYSCIF